MFLIVPAWSTKALLLLLIADSLICGYAVLDRL
jgi:hypothetical protein